MAAGCVFALCLWAGAAHAASGLASARADRLLVVGATQTAADQGRTRAGLWLDVDGGHRESGLTWGLRLGWQGEDQGDAVQVLGAGGLAGSGRVGYALGVLAWNGGWAGELILSSDVWLAWDRSTWWSEGGRVAPRVGLRLLLGYGAPVRARVRVDVAPAVFASGQQQVQMSALWLRVGLDVGPVTVGLWGMAFDGKVQQGGAWRSPREVGAGVAIGLRAGRDR